MAQNWYGEDGLTAPLLPLLGTVKGARIENGPPNSEAPNCNFNFLAGFRVRNLLHLSNKSWNMSIRSTGTRMVDRIFSSISSLSHHLLLLQSSILRLCQYEYHPVSKVVSEVGMIMDDQPSNLSDRTSDFHHIIMIPDTRVVVSKVHRTILALLIVIAEEANWSCHKRRSAHHLCGTDIKTKPDCLQFAFFSHRQEGISESKTGTNICTTRNGCLQDVFFVHDCRRTQNLVGL